jgi:hypothetical protein
MTIKEQLLLAIDTLPADRLPIALAFVESLSEPTHQPQSTNKSFLNHLQTLELGWAGDDFEECLEIVINSRSPLTFEAVNPLDEPFLTSETES